MALIEWNDGLKLGVTTIDRQHQRLIGIANRLEDAVKQGLGPDVISETMDDLIIYTASHFSMEEEYFALFDYADAEEHKLEHAALIEKVKTFAANYHESAGTNGPAFAEEMLQFLGIWLRYHMLETDAKFVKLFKERGLD